MEQYHTLDISLPSLITLLIVLLLCSAFFSGSEIGMMSLNKYRLKHLAKTNKIARIASKLLLRPDRLLGTILIGNTFANIFASSIATLIGAYMFGELGVLIATILLTIVILIFSEILPKTLAALKPEKIALFSTIPLQLLLWILFPFIWLANGISNTILFLFGIKVKTTKKHDQLTIEELRIAISETSSFIPYRYKSMLSSILDLDKISVNDIMIPKSEVIGIDLDDEKTSIIDQFTHIQHTVLPVFRSNLENVEGIIHMRDISKLSTKNKFEIEDLKNLMCDPYFVPSLTSLYQQLVNFQHNKTRVGLVVDEYGSILGIVTLEDILKEIVGEFTTDKNNILEFEIYPQNDGSFIVDGSINIRVLNKNMNWNLPANNAKTLSGAIIEKLETIPEPATCLLLNDYPVEILQVQDNMVKTAKVFERLKKQSNE